MANKEALETLIFVGGLIVEDLCKKEIEIIEKDLDKLEQYEAIFKEPLKNIRERLEDLKTIKEFIMERIALYDNGMCLDEYIYNSEPVAKIIRKWENEK